MEILTLKRLLLALSLCVIVAGLCGTSFATPPPRPIFTSTSLSVCKQLVDPGQPVCFTSQTIAFTPNNGPVAVPEGEVCFFDEFSGELGCVDVNRFGQAQICLPITADVDVSAFYDPYGDNNNTGVGNFFLVPSHSTEKAVFVTSDPGPPTYFPGTHPGCLIPHIFPPL
jgi:hypothetical protein